MLCFFSSLLTLHSHTTLNVRGWPEQKDTHTHSLSPYRNKIPVCFDLCHVEGCEIPILKQMV